MTFRIQPQVMENFTTWPWGIIFPALAVGGLAGVRRWFSGAIVANMLFATIRILP
jgi:hypothetical protein